jgi:3-oxoadipate enol-lactonase / 4-carboxymuconolactone decarboxylase
MFVQLGDVMVHAQQEGPASGPAVLLLHSLSANLHMWDPQAAALAKRYCVIRMDMRGHGLTTAPRRQDSGDYSMAMLARDAFALLDALGVRQAHVAGVSIGGRIALQMAAMHPDQVLSLIPCDTALEFQPASTWQERMDAVRKGGMAAVAEGTMGRWVLDQSLASSQALRRMILTTDPQGFLGCAAALRDSRAAEVEGITCPTTVMVGEKDPSTPPDAAKAVQAAIPGAALHVIPEAAHIPNFEQEAAMTRTLLQHMEQVTALPSDRQAAGMAVRKRVLGEAHVARSEAALMPIDKPFRDFILEGAWGSVWTRPGLPHRDRSLLCLGMLAALGHHDEFRLHVRATRNTGVTEEEIAEVLLQVAVYGGVPAANTALKIAKETLKEMQAP